MLNVVKEVQGNSLIVRLSGVIDETVNLEQLIGPAPQREIHLYLKEVSRLNSMGVKVWVKYFEAVAKRGTLLRVFEMSPVIVGQLNLMGNFIPNAKFESVCAPYLCTKCKSQFVAVYKADTLAGLMEQMPPQKCPKCSASAEFDDIESEYFSFLTRRT